MEKKRQIKVSLGAVISVFIIILLTMALIGMYCYYNFIMIPKYEVANNEKENIVGSNNNNENDVEKKLSQEEEVSPYEKYEELYWHFKDNEEDNTKISYVDRKIQIENGIAYLYEGNAKTEITSIEGKAKYVNAWGEQALDRVYILTEEGTIWKSDYLDNNFSKVNFNEKVIDMTNGNMGITNLTNGNIDQPFFLLDNGELMNESRNKYEEVWSFTKSFGSIEGVICVKDDNTMYTYENNKFVQIKDENGNSIKMQDAFIQRHSSWNEVYSTDIIERIFVRTEDNKLFYFDGYKNVIAKEYKETAGKLIDTIAEEKEKVNVSGEINNIKVTFTDGTEKVIRDAGRNFFRNH